MIRNVTNTSPNPITLDDLSGALVNPGQTIDGLAFGEEMFRNSASIINGLMTGVLSVSDGSATYTGAPAVDFIRGYATQFTIDGKPITTSSDRPANTYRCFSGRGDDIVSNPKKIGLGPDITFDVAPGATQSVDCHFVDNVFVKDGAIRYTNAVPDTTLSVDVICPAGIPFPSPTKTGTLDLVGSTWTPNTHGTGAFMTAPVEVILFRFINHMHLIGSDREPISSPESFQLVTPYFLRFTLVNSVNNPVNVQAGVMMGMYRYKTL